MAEVTEKPVNLKHFRVYYWIPYTGGGAIPANHVHYGIWDSISDDWGNRPTDNVICAVMEDQDGMRWVEEGCGVYIIDEEGRFAGQELTYDLAHRDEIGQNYIKFDGVYLNRFRYVFILRGSFYDKDYPAVSSQQDEGTPEAEMYQQYQQ